MLLNSVKIFKYSNVIVPLLFLCAAELTQIGWFNVHRKVT